MAGGLTTGKKVIQIWYFKTHIYTHTLGEEKMALSCTKRDLGLMSGKISPLKGLSGTGTGCPGSGGHHP